MEKNEAHGGYVSRADLSFDERAEGDTSVRGATGLQVGRMGDHSLPLVHMHEVLSKLKRWIHKDSLAGRVTATVEARLMKRGVRGEGRGRGERGAGGGVRRDMSVVGGYAGVRLGSTQSLGLGLPPSSVWGGLPVNLRRVYALFWSTAGVQRTRRERGRRMEEEGEGGEGGIDGGRRGGRGVTNWIRSVRRSLASSNVEISCPEVSEGWEEGWRRGWGGGSGMG